MDEIIEDEVSAMKKSRIGVLTGGGDCAGLNPAIKLLFQKLDVVEIEELVARGG